MRAVQAEAATASESMAMPMPEFVFESAPSDFEVARVLNLYLPVLYASYSLAKQEPFALPGGYRKLGEVRVSTAETVEAVVNATREEKQAIEHDREALVLDKAPEADVGMAPSVSTEPAVALEALDDPGAFGFVLQEDATKSVIVSFRGTQTPKEWAADFAAVAVPFREVQGFGWVHVGFDAFYHSVRESIRRALQGVDASARVTVVGHSLGAAMALLCAVDIERNLGKKNVDVCTFGGPRAARSSSGFTSTARSPSVSGW